MFRIKKLDIFITKQFGLLFVGTFFICQFVLMMQFLWRYVDELIGKGLSLDIMGQLFWYMGLMLIPQAFPLAILLSSLITFGNLGESSELTAIKAAGISLMQTFRPLIVIVMMIAGVSFYFQDIVAPFANQSFYRLLLSVKQKSPEVEIPEGIFYDGIPGSNIYVQKKNLNTGMLYGVMIYRQSGSYEDQAIILADSGMMQTTAEKKHLLLSLYSGEWFENMRSQDLGQSAAVPYRRETFSTKKILLDFDSGFNLADINDISGDARAKSLDKILHDLDSIKEFNDSVGHAFYREAKRFVFRRPGLGKEDSLKAVKEVASEKVNYDSVFAHLSNRTKQEAVTYAMNNIQSSLTDLEFKAEYAKALHRRTRTHQIEAINKFTLALSCIIFFFIGAPLGAIIRKGGLGVPVIVSVLVFIVYFIFENSGMKMARDDQWTVWFGKLISTVVLTPVAAFFTYKANNDSVVFNMDLYKNLFMRMLGLREKRHIMRKEVIIEDPKYTVDADLLINVNQEILAYSDHHKLLRWPNPINVFFHAGDDQEIEKINNALETAIEDLSYSTDRLILTELNNYPIIATRAHTRPFRRKWLNIVTGLILPLGIFFYFRMLRFRFRLYKDLRTIRQTSDRIVPRALELSVDREDITTLI
ncbi:MAG: LptF/LptG family permease [Prevotella sp.]|nr:LptF/LptG family permease [Prevotella sp.]